MATLNAKVTTGDMSVAQGVEQALAIDRTNGLVARDAVQEGGFAKRVYMASMQAAAALGTALTATNVTLSLTNPSASTKRLRVLSVGLSISSPPGGIAQYVLGLVSSPAVDPVTNTLALIRRSDGSVSAGTGLAHTASTLGAVPIVIATLGAIAATGYIGVTNFRIAPSWLVLGPGNSIVVQGLTTASTGIADMAWEEIDQ